MPALLNSSTISVDGSLSDWLAFEQIDYGEVNGFHLYATEQNGYFYFALVGTVAFGTGTTLWLNTDLNTATGVNAFAGVNIGADYDIALSNDGTGTVAAFQSNGTTVALASGDFTYAMSTSGTQTVAEFAIKATDLGSPSAIDTYYQVNNAVYGPSDYTSQPYVAFASTGIEPTTSAARIGIVYSATSAANYFSQTAYDDLVMSAEYQATQAGIPYDVLTESDLTNLSKLVNYSALVFPDFTNVQSSQVTAITNTLLEATRQYGVGLITSGDFMTNDQTGAVLSGDPYSRMKIFFDATRQTGGNSADVSIYDSDPTQTVFKNTDPGALIRDYSGVGWTAYSSVSGTGQTVATQVVGGQTYSAAMTSQSVSGAKNVLFSSNGVMADSNLLSQAIDYVTQPSGLTVNLDMTRFNGIVATRMDMDQSQFPSEISPESGSPGIYDVLIPILQQWQQTYNFVGSYYVNIGDNPNAADPSMTNWSASLPYYQSILATGGEIGTHSYSHLINTPTTTFTATTTADAPPGSIQITLDSIPAFAGVTVGMVISGLNIGANTPLPGVAGEGGSVANTTVTAVNGNTITISYVPQGYGTANVGTLGDVPAGTTLTFSVPSENTNFLQTTGTIASGTNNPFTFDYEFNQSKLLLEQMLGTTVYGAAVPGANDTAATSANILQYFPSSSGYTGYVTGGYTGVGSGYPSAIGYLDPTNTNSIYIAPNLTFDFTEVLYQGKSADQALIDWESQMATIAANSSGPPVYVWPIHDYGVTAWDTSDSGLTSPFTTTMYSDLISYMSSKGLEFVTLEDLASRITNFNSSGVTETVNGNVISATVAASHAGEFALSIANQGTQIIQNVGTWYAYNNTDVLLPSAGGSFNITVGTTADAVTHISALPMRADLISVTGDGVNLGFSVVGDGIVTINAGAVGTLLPAVAGATIASYDGHLLQLSLTGGGTHDVTVKFENPPSETVAGISFSNDSGASPTDFITNIATQTVSGVVSAPLSNGDIVKVSLDNGVTWQTVAVTPGATTFTLPGVTLVTSNTLVAEVTTADGLLASTPLRQAYVLDQVPPTETAAIVAMTNDSGLAGDFITNDGTAGRVVSGTLSAPLAAGDTLMVSNDGGVTWAAATVTGTTWTETDTLSHSTNWTIEAEVVDLAGNTGTVAAQAVVYDNTPPAAPAMILATASDSGLSNSDDITNVTTPTFSGTTEAGSTVSLFDGVTLLGTVVATGTTWAIGVPSPQALVNNGTHTITAQATDVAGNIGPSATLAVVIDTIAPGAPSNVALAPQSDSGISNADGTTNVRQPTMTGTGEAGGVVTLLDISSTSTTAIGSGTVAADGTWSITSTTTLADGVHKIAAVEMDVAGNIGVNSGTIAVTIDTVAPTAPTGLKLAAGSDNGSSATDNVTSITTPTVSGTAVAGSLVTLSDTTAGITTTIGTAVASATGAWSIASTTALPGGVNSLTATAMDVAGNLSVASAALAVTVVVAATTPSVPDMVAATDTGTSNTDNVTRNTTPRFTGTSEAGATVSLFDNGVLLTSGKANASGVWTITAPVLADGTHAISAQAVDQFGLISGMSGSLTAVIDTIAPATPSTPVLTATSDSGVVGDGITNVRTPTFAGTAEPGSTVTLYRATATGTAKIGTAVADAASGAWAITSTATLTQGAQIITATATDLAGNVSAISTATTITIDSVAPTRPPAPTLAAGQDTGVSATDRITRINTPTFNGTAETNSTVTLYDGATAIGTVIATGGTYAIAAPTLADGVHSMTVKASDAAGNVSTASPITAVTIDTTAPVAPRLTAGTATRLNGTGEAGDIITISNGISTLGTATVGSAGSWSWTFIAPTSQMAVSALQTDKAGNVSATAATALIGTAGADILTAGSNQLLIGGASADTFVFGTGFGADIIADFAATGTAHDIITFQGNSTLNSYAAVIAHTTIGSTGAVISDGFGNSLTLNNVTNIANLGTADFKFA